MLDIRQVKISQSNFNMPKNILLTVLILLFSCWQQAKIEGKVVSVKDGDTIEILYKNKPVRIRLYGIDCPEKNQDFGTKAKEYTSTLCFGKTVKVKSFGKDKYGRLLGQVILPDSKQLNEELVRAGMAWRYKYSKDQYLAQLETTARKNKIGLWKGKDPVAPWEFRLIKRKVPR